VPDQIDLGDVVIGKTVDWWNLNKIQPAIPNKGSEHLLIGDSFFRKDLTLGIGQHTNSWNKRLTDFQNSDEERLPSNDDSKMLALKSRITAAANPRSNLIHYGKIVSWEFVLSHGDLRDELRTLTVDGLAIEMEGAGFYSSIRRRNDELDVQQRRTNRIMGIKVEGFIFRGISDLSHRKDSEDRAWRKIAMNNAASAMLNFVRTFTDIDFRN
jgi:hypothetical protein